MLRLSSNRGITRNQLSEVSTVIIIQGPQHRSPAYTLFRHSEWSRKSDSAERFRSYRNRKKSSASSRLGGNANEPVQSTPCAQHHGGSQRHLEWFTRYTIQDLVGIWIYQYCVLFNSLSIIPENFVVPCHVEYTSCHVSYTPFPPCKCVP